MPLSPPFSVCVCLYRKLDRGGVVLPFLLLSQLGFFAERFKFLNVVWGGASLRLAANNFWCILPLKTTTISAQC